MVQQLMSIKITVLITGPAGAGKSQFMYQLLDNSFTEVHVSMPQIAQKVLIGHPLQPYVTFAETELRFYQNANICILCIDVRKPYLLSQQYNLTRQELPNKNCLLTILGTFSDVADKAQMDKFMLLGQKLGHVFLCSSKLRIGVEEVILASINEYIEKYFVFDCSVKGL
ncbi:Ras-like GTPase superfamily protein [Spironucleus salmonicida]|uniref:Ras-like GTPase superfamily protein n=1 Tax=Spironucleus salmonicida TaxID=348837 RepID=V6LLF4_9EUKA|nr:Ras-like GTPase superfamily protein [Spironucleus salmonicida]|eukprot:EST45377.1 Ras-like GTPase superfamily protein [Spironucleus salmonicida]